MLKSKARSMAEIALCSAILCVSAFIVVPLPAIPFTLQILAVVLCALILKPLQALIAQLVYTLIGIAGLPVFSAGQGGLGVIFSPTGGFIIGFILASFLISLCKGRRVSILRYTLVSVLVGLPVIYLCGVIGFMLVTSTDIFSAFMAVTSVLAVIDILKCIVASTVAVAIHKSLKNLPERF